LQAEPLPQMIEPGGWQDRLRRTVVQESLFETTASLAGIAGLACAPRAVFAGVGLCSRSDLSVALPVDLLGILLPAEQVRRAIGAGTTVALVADEHALGNGFHPDRVRQRTGETVAILRRLSTVMGLEIEVVRASSFHGSTRYRRILAEVGLRAAPGDDAYFHRQVADLEYMHRTLGGIVKVGWVVSGSPRVARRRDELAFDQRFRAWVGRHVGFVYCKAGRTLDDRRPKASPYVVVDPSRRICLGPDEDVSGKLQRAGRQASAATVNGARRHLKAIARASRAVTPLTGPVEHRLQQMIRSIFDDEPWTSSYASTSGR